MFAFTTKYGNFENINSIVLSLSNLPLTAEGGLSILDLEISGIQGMPGDARERILRSEISSRDGCVHCVL